MGLHMGHMLLRDMGEQGSERSKAGEQREGRAGVGGRPEDCQDPDLEQEPESQVGDQTRSLGTEERDHSVSFGMAKGPSIASLSWLPWGPVLLLYLWETSENLSLFPAHP